MSSFDRDEIVDVALDYIAESDRAFLVSNGKIERWLPKSQIQNLSEIKRHRLACSAFLMPRWLAQKEDLI